VLPGTDGLEGAIWMMTQEEFMNVKALRAAGWTIRQIAKHLGYHPATVSGWLKAGGPPPKRSVPVEELVVDERWRRRIDALLAHNNELQATSIMRVIRAEGFDGSYASLTRHLRAVRGPSRAKESVVTVPIETAPGEEFQFDWSDCNRWARRWGWEHELHCFGAVLCWSRVKCWWFSPSIERPPTFEGLVRFFEAVDGVPAVGRTDRMGCLGRSRGKAFIWHPPALEFARHYGFALKACERADAARKGKVERPFADLKGGFLPEMDLDPPADIGELNRRVEPWLAAYVHAVAHRTTSVAPEVRLRTEQPVLGPLPPSASTPPAGSPAGWAGCRWSSGTASSTPRPRRPPASWWRPARRSVRPSWSCAWVAGSWPSTEPSLPAATRNGCRSTGPRPRPSPSAATAVTCVPWPTSRSRGVGSTWARATTTWPSPT
jgi:transposase